MLKVKVLFCLLCTWATLVSGTVFCMDSEGVNGPRVSADREAYVHALDGMTVALGRYFLGHPSATFEETVPIFMTAVMVSLEEFRLRGPGDKHLFKKAFWTYLGLVTSRLETCIKHHQDLQWVGELPRSNALFSTMASELFGKDDFVQSYSQLVEDSVQAREVSIKLQFDVMLYVTMNFPPVFDLHPDPLPPRL